MQPVFMEKLHVLGSGAMGLLFSSMIRIAFPSYPICVLLRPHHESKLHVSSTHGGNNKKKYVQVNLIQNNRPRMVFVPAEVILDSTNNKNKPITNLLVATKAMDAIPAVQSVLSRLDKNGKRIILLCNGALAVKDELQSLLQESCIDNKDMKLVLASTTHGAFREGLEDDEDIMFHVTHAGVGTTWIENEPELAQLWDRAGLECQSVHSDQAVYNLWQKLGANCVINPLTALHQVPNGDLRHLDNDVQHAIIKEVVQVAQAVTTTTSQNLDGMKQFCDKVIQDTKDNKSSMLQDVLNEKPTEIDYLNGYIVQCGKQLGIETPANLDICERIHRLTESYTER